jgi:GAF domain-containing protein
MPSPESPQYSWPPSVSGFDMPSSAPSAGEGGEPVMLAFLSGRPDRHWIEAFTSEVAEFQSQHHLSDVHLDARGLVLQGPSQQLRSLTAHVRNFVHRVSRISLQRRVMERLLPGQLSDEENAAAKRDVDLVARMPAVANILEEVSRATGMRFATVARVSDSRWTACAVYDTIDYGLRAGQDIALETTICNEIRKHGRTVVFNHASTHPLFASHPTPALYGFESYISVPIYLADGRFFGTLCAVDPQPRELSQPTVQLLERFARAIGSELDSETSISGISLSSGDTSCP